MKSIKSAFMDGLGLTGFQKIESVRYKGYEEDIKNFKKDAKKIADQYQSKNVKK